MTDEYLAVYGGISAANTLFTLFRAFFFAYAGKAGGLARPTLIGVQYV
jgi:hypothetical protein